LVDAAAAAVEFPLEPELPLLLLDELLPHAASAAVTATAARTTLIFPLVMMISFSSRTAV
jgi:hypothetical protein